MCMLLELFFVTFPKAIKLKYSQFHKTLPKSSLQMQWFSARFYEMGDMSQAKVNIFLDYCIIITCNNFSNNFCFVFVFITNYNMLLFILWIFSKVYRNVQKGR